jgi:hypothetical protein
MLALNKHTELWRNFKQTVSRFASGLGGREF